MGKNLIGYGSFFHSVEGQQLGLPTVPFPYEYQLYYAGRYALKHVFETIAGHRTISTLWLPEYYCPFVKNWLAHEFDNLAYYPIDPFDAKAQPEWSRFNAQTDIVLVNNYWGLKTHELPSTERPFIVEDHSHGWLTEGALNSDADFCIASLRKTVPLPLGGIAWKPKNSTLDFGLSPIDKSTGSENGPMAEAWGYMEMAMDQKAAYHNANAPKTYLDTYAQGENCLRNHYEIVGPKESHRKVLQAYAFFDYNAPKAKNHSYVGERLLPSTAFKLVAQDGRTPFGLLLAFKDWQELIDLQSFLITGSIFSAELWPQNEIAQEYRYLLNVHIDFRYTDSDCDHIAEQLNQWITKT